MTFWNGPMRISSGIAAMVGVFALLGLCACTGVVGLAHGDPGRDSSSTQAPESQAPAPPTTAALPTTAAPGLEPPATDTLVPSAPVRREGAPARSESAAVSAVVVTLSAHAQELAESDPRLSADAIAQAVEHELTAHQLYQPAASGVHRSLAITVQEFASSLASNASLLGFTFRNVILTCTVQVQGDAAGLQPPFDVHARVRTSTRNASSSADSLAGLYTQFAQTMVADLRGVAPPELPIPR
jgi:hypothetical protein